MQPDDTKNSDSQADLFRSSLESIIDVRHPLVVLAKRIDWDRFASEFGALYSEGKGRPGLPTRLMVGLHYLKHAFNESDESVVDRFVENPYWQYFCGMTHFVHDLPLHPTSLTRWRQRMGAEGIEPLLAETIEVAKRSKLLTRTHVAHVNVDTTVQEKAIAFPTDSRLYEKARCRLVEEAKRRGIGLRQTYVRLGKRAFVKQARYRHAKQMKRANRETRRLRTYLGRVIRDLRRKCPDPDVSLDHLLHLAERIFTQKRHDQNKLYSLHAPEVECIAKGKAHKPYEFGCKVSIATTSKDNWVVGIDAMHGSPYDGKTLVPTLNQVESLTGWKVKSSCCDRGYRGKKYWPKDTEVFLSGRRRLTRSQRRWLKRRSAVEPVIGHIKTDCRMNRNHLLGREGDRINAMLAGAAFNLRKLLAGFFVRFLSQWQRRIWVVIALFIPNSFIDQHA